MLAATHRSAPPRDAHAQRVSADELAAAVDVAALDELHHGLAELRVRACGGDGA